MDYLGNKLSTTNRILTYSDLSNIIGTTTSDTAPLGSDLNTIAGSGANWSGTSFAIGYTHTAGAVATLTSTLTPTSGLYYQITATLTTPTNLTAAGSITINFGGISSAISATACFSILTTTAASLSILPTTDYNGILVLVIKLIGTSTATSIWSSSDGSSKMEIRANTAVSNTFIGVGAGARSTTSYQNTFIGAGAGANTSCGLFNTFIGAYVGSANLNGEANVFIGNGSGGANTNGARNVFIGNTSGNKNTIGGYNVFMGYNSGNTNIVGNQNTFIGYSAGFSANSSYNSFFGNFAGGSTTSGLGNTFLGTAAGGNNITGSQNTFLGYNAGRYIASAATVAATTLNNSIFIGYNARPLLDSQTNQIVIGTDIPGLGSNTTLIGNASTTVTAIYGDLLLGTQTDLPSSILTVASTTKGILIPQMTTSQKLLISSPATGLQVYDTTLGIVSWYNGTAWINTYNTTLTGGVTTSTSNVATVVTNANLTGDVTSIGNASTVVALNGTVLSSLATGILKNTTASGVPSIAVAADYPTLNQNTTGTSANVSGTVAIANGGTGAASITAALNNLGLNNVNNTSDALKPISNAVQTQLNLLAPIASPTFTGTPTLPTGAVAVTQAVGTNTTALATTAFVLANVGGNSQSKAAPYLSITASTEITTTSTADVATDMTLSMTAGTYVANFNAQYSIVAGNQTTQAVTDLTTAYNYLMGLKATNTTHATAFGGETLTPGIYTVPAAGSLAGNLVLDGQGNTAAIFVFRFGAAFNTGAGTVVSFTNGAQSSNVYWIAEGAIGCGATTTMKGTMIAHGAAVSLGASCNLDGRMLSTTGAIGIDTCTITTPSSSSSCNLGVCSSFCMFTSNGGLTNAGTTTITGNIGTNSGTITGFGSATITGNQYTAGSAGFATATFSIYQNGVLIANSQRLRTSTSSNDVYLQAVATVTNNQNIDVRWSTTLGTIKLQNRILTTIQVV